MNQIFEALRRVGWHGFSGLLLLGTFCSLTWYAVQQGLSAQEELVGALVVLIGAGGKTALDQFGRGNGA